MLTNLDLTFENIYWLLAIIPAIISYFIYRQAKPSHYLVFPGIKFLDKKQSLQQKSGGLKPHHFLLGLILLTLVIGLANPCKKITIQEKEQQGIDIMLALDISLSMDIRDFHHLGIKETRLEAAKRVAQEFIKLRDHDRIGMVIFSGQPYRISPITFDHNWLIQQIKDIEINSLKEQGTAIGSAIAASSLGLKKQKAKSKIIVLITDGANNAGKLKPNDAAELAEELGIRIYTIAIGSDDKQVEYQNRIIKQNQFDTTSLMEISEITHGIFHRAQTAAKLNDAFEKINELETTSFNSPTYDQIISYRPYLIVFVLILLTLFVLMQYGPKK